MEKLKRAVVKEELVVLTGNANRAIVLNQMIYWSERTKDADKFLKDEIARSHMAMGKEEMENAEKLEELDLFSHGWIYKSAIELSEETMIGVSKSTMGTYLKHLVDNGWLDKRKNPKWKGDNTFQYRVNLVKLQSDLEALGYALEGYPLLNKSENTTPMSNNRTSEFGNETDGSEIEQPVRKSNNQFGNETTLPKTTTKTTTKIKTNNSFLLSPDVDINQLNLPMPLKKFLYENRDKGIKLNIDLYELEEFYNMSEYIKPLAGKEDYNYLNNFDFTKLVKDIYKKEIIVEKSTTSLLNGFVLNRLQFKAHNTLSEAAVVASEGKEIDFENNPLINKLLQQ